MRGVTVLLLLVAFLLSFQASACGTVDNWMDAYEGVESHNKWRDSMNKLESLVMLKGCGSSIELNKQQQNRMSKILTYAVSHKKMISYLPSVNRDIRSEVSRYKGLVAYDRLLKQIYRRYLCLPDIKHNINLSLDNNVFVDFFDMNKCR